MGIDINFISILAEYLASGDVSPGNVITFGKQVVKPELGDMNRVLQAHGFRNARDNTDKQLFAALGIENHCSLDVSPYEGADLIFDLNNPEIPGEHRGKYDMVFTGGTIEHVFNASNAVRHSVDLLAENGVLVHLGPSNNWLNHGFYQLSPALMLDYLAENNYEILLSVLAIKNEEGDQAAGPSWDIISATPGGVQMYKQHQGRSLHILLARKLANSTIDKIPTQWIYQFKHEHGFGTNIFPVCKRYRLRNGVKEEHPYDEISINTSSIQQIEGNLYSVELDKKFKKLGGIEKEPFRSPLLFFENERMFSHVTLDRQAMISGNSGAYLHKGSEILFNSMDGSDPRSNGKRYKALIPR